MEEKKGCKSCKRKNFELNQSEKTLVWIAVGLILFSVYGVVSLIGDIISLF